MYKIDFNWIEDNKAKFYKMSNTKPEMSPIRDTENDEQGSKKMDPVEDDIVNLGT